MTTTDPDAATAGTGDRAGSAVPARRGTGTRATRLVGGLTVLAMGWLVLFGLVLSPADANQGETVRLMYVHVYL